MLPAVTCSWAAALTDSAAGTGCCSRAAGPPAAPGRAWPVRAVSAVGQAGQCPLTRVA